MITDKQAEEIVLLAELGNCSYHTAAVALGHKINIAYAADDELAQWTDSMMVMRAKHRLDAEWERTHAKNPYRT